MSTIAYFQGGPMTLTAQCVPEARETIFFAVPEPTGLTLPEGVQPTSTRKLTYRIVGGWGDKYGNKHVTYQFVEE